MLGLAKQHIIRLITIYIWNTHDPPAGGTHTGIKALCVFASLREINIKQMKQYMIEISLPDNPDDGFFDMIPRQHEVVKRFLRQGTITGYTLSADRRKIWVLASAYYRFEVINLLDSFPIRKYIQYHIHDLLFHHTSKYEPQFWLN